MKQTLYRYSRPFRGEVREGVLIALETKNGQVGWGEVAPLPGFSQETLDEAIKDLIEGNDSSLPSVQWGKSSAILDLLNPIEIESIENRNDRFTARVVTRVETVLIVDGRVEL